MKKGEFSVSSETEEWIKAIITVALMAGAYWLGHRDGLMEGNEEGYKRSSHETIELADSTSNDHAIEFLRWMEKVGL